MSKPADLKGDRRLRSANHAHPRRRGDRVRDPLHVRPGRSRHVNVVESDGLRSTSAFGGSAEMSWLSPSSPKPQQEPFSASHGEGAHRIASSHHSYRDANAFLMANSRLSGAPMEA